MGEVGCLLAGNRMKGVVLAFDSYCLPTRLRFHSKPQAPDEGPNDLYEI